MESVNEDAFAAEAQEQASLALSSSRQRRPDANRPTRGTDNDDADDENSPLMPSFPERPQNKRTRSQALYDRAINKPWTGGLGSEGQSWLRKPSIYWLLPAFFPFCLSFGGLIVPRTYLILNLICQDYLSDRSAKDPSFHFMPVMLDAENPQCQNREVQALMANFQLYSSFLAGFFSAIVTPYLGALSDRVGRRRIIAFAAMGSFLSELITIIVGRRGGEISVYWILVGSLLDGLCGSFTTSMAVSFAYATDCTPPERRNVAFGYFHGTMFTGIALGPILAGYLIKLTGTIMVVFYVGIGCNLFFIVFLLLCIPESVSKERQQRAQEKHEILMQDPKYETWLTTLRSYNIFEPLWILYPTGEGSSPQLRRNLILLASIDTIMFGVAMGTMSIILIYANFKFQWDVVDSSKFLSAVNSCRVAALFIVLPLLTRLVRGPTGAASGAHHGADGLDVNLIRAAVFFDLFGYIGYATVQTGTLLVVSGAIASLGGIGSPTLQSALTKHVPSDRTGQVLGASGLLHALSRVIAPVVLNFIYGRTVGIFSQLVFVCLAGLFLIAFVMTWFLRPNLYLAEPSVIDDDDEQEHEL